MVNANANLVATDDPDLNSGMVQYPGQAGSVKAYLSRPKEGNDLGAVIVIHENKGLNDHILDVTRRLAKEGIAALGVDLMSRLGGSDQYSTQEEAIAAIKQVDKDSVVQDLQSAVDYLKQQPFANGRVGVVGFCWGGAHSLNFATKCPELKAAVVFYGRNPDPLDQMQNIACPLLGNYGEDDPNIMPGVESLRATLKEFGKTFDIKVFPGAKHAFNNNTNAERYHPEAASDAWARTVNFFKERLVT